MIKNYLKAAINSMWRRKWFSLLTLFSIAISLVVVICMVSFWNMLSAPIKPEVNKERTFYIHKEYFRKDNGKKVWYHTAKEVVPKDFYSKTVHKLTNVKLASVYENGRAVRDYFKDGIGKSYVFRATDANFFKIFDFKFINGKPYSKNMLENKDKVCVISDEMANHFFGTPYCIGKEICEGYTNIKVIGVFKQSSHITPIQSDIYIGKDKRLIQHSYDDLETALLCDSKNDIHNLAKEIDLLSKKYSSNNKKFEVRMEVKTSIDKIITVRYQNRPMSKVRYIGLILLILILPFFSLFELLKSNLTTHLEEIGTRKAFGATNKIINRQLVFKNVLITILSGMLGMVFALFFFKTISGKNLSNLFSDFFHWRALIYYLLAFVVMGILSGIIPSIQLSKTPIIDALNQGNKIRQSSFKFIRNWKGQITSGIISICAFFIIILAFNEVNYGLQMSLKPSLPFKTNDRIVIRIAYNHDSYEHKTDKVSGRVIPNLKPIKAEVKKEIEYLRDVEISSFAEQSVENGVRTYWDLRNQTKYGVLCGFNYGKVFDLELEQGRWFQKTDQEAEFPPVVITRLHANELGIEKLANHTFFKFKSDKYDLKFRVVGIIKDLGKTNDFNMIPFFAPFNVSKGNSVSSDFRIVKIREGADIYLVKKEIENIYKSKGWDNKFYRFQVDILDELMHQKFVRHLRMYSIEYGIMSMLLCFIAVILFGSTLRQVNSRVQELGIRRSVGASQTRVIRMVLFERLTFFFITIGVALLIYLNSYKSLQIQYSIIAPLVSAVLIFVMVLIAALIPAIQAGRIQPVEALADE